MSGSVTVSGGTHGVEVQEYQLTRLAGRLGHTGADSVAAAVSLHSYLLDPDIALSALFDPAGYAAFDAALLAALDGVSGLSWVGARCGLADLALRGAVAAYNAAEMGVQSLTVEVELPAAVGYFLLEKAATGSTSLAAQRTITRFPGTADALVDELGLVGLVRAEASAGGSLDGHGVAVRTGQDRSPAATAPPRSLRDLIDALGRRDQDPHHGAVDVRILTRPGGSRAVIVDVTGTKSWTLARTSDVTSLITNARALVGDRTSYEQGVLQAMTQAGVRPNDDVMIIGHSEGGMVAVNTARHAVRDGRFHVTHVITAGSPIGLTVGDLPRSVKVLALENTADVVPHLDGTANPDRVNVTTVSGRYGNGTVTGDHDINADYAPLASDAQASADPSMRDYLDSCRGYFDATGATTTAYQIVRKY